MEQSTLTLVGLSNARVYAYTFIIRSEAICSQNQALRGPNIIGCDDKLRAVVTVDNHLTVDAPYYSN